MFLQRINQYYTTYQAVQLFCLRLEKEVAYAHKHLLYHNNLRREQTEILFELNFRKRLYVYIYFECYFKIEYVVRLIRSTFPHTLCKRKIK